MSSFKIWLSASALQQLTAGNEQQDKPKYRGYIVDTSKQSDGKYITFYLDPTDPTVDMPRIKRSEVKAITFDDSYHEGFHPEGIYKHRGAKAVVRTNVDVRRPFATNSMDQTSIERKQNISITAKSFIALRNIYTQIRQGNIMPTEEWSDGGCPGVYLTESKDMMSMM